MCICCREAEVDEPVGLCPRCAIALRGEVLNGMHELEAYLEAWASFSDWLLRTGRA